MKYKYKIDYKSIGGSTSSSSTSSSASSDNTSGSTTFDNKIEYIDTIINNLGYEEGNNRLISTIDYTPIEKQELDDDDDDILEFDDVKEIKKKWDESKNLNSNDRIKNLFQYLHRRRNIIKNFNMFDNLLLQRAVTDWFKDKYKAI